MKIYWIANLGDLAWIVAVVLLLLAVGFCWVVAKVWGWWKERKKSK